jgi:hypothetical protein
MTNEEHGSAGQGPATDAAGNPVIDPTANVLNLVDAAVLRLDDLRKAEALRQDGLRDAAAQYSRDMARLRSVYEDKLRAAETERIDAIRAVDVGAVSRAAEVQAAAASALAAQVLASAEAMRTQVAATAQAGTIALNAALDPIQKTIDDLRRAQYEAQGQKAQTTEQRLDTGSLLVAVFGSFGVLVGVGGIIVALVR